MLRNLAVPVLVVLSILTPACQKGADTPQQAAEMLTATPNWKIQEISVNDAVTFKDGKMTKQFGGIEFERYMETVQLKPDGTFSGVFKGETKPFVMNWKAGKEAIEVGLADNKSGNWTISPADVEQNAFTMKTQSTAYDYPRTTKIALKFQAAQ